MCLVHPLYIHRAQAFRRTFDFKLYVFSVTETIIPVEAVNIVTMDENISAAVRWFNEAVAFLGVEPFYFTLCHCGVVILHCARKSKPS